MTDPGRIIAVDYGKRRVGLAISDPTHTIAFPLQTLDRTGSNLPLEEEIASIVRNREVGQIIVGLPLTTEGERSQRAREVEAFVQRLRHRTDCPIRTYDERFSSARAVRAIHEMGEKVGREKGRVDRIAAVFILQGYLDSIQGEGETPRSVSPPGRS